MSTARGDVPNTHPQDHNHRHEHQMPYLKRAGRRTGASPCVWRQDAATQGAESKTPRMGLHPVTLFRGAISTWVLAVAVAVGFTCWYVVSTNTAAAVDALAWRMTGVVRTLAVKQVCVAVAAALFKVPRA